MLGKGSNRPSNEAASAFYSPLEVVAWSILDCASNGINDPSKLARYLFRDGG